MSANLVALNKSHNLFLGFGYRRAGILVAGDLVALITFAVIGRYSHGLTGLNWDVIQTADPFIAGKS